MIPALSVQHDQVEDDEIDGDHRRREGDVLKQRANVLPGGSLVEKIGDLTGKEFHKE
jgi:hypothetical protein